MKRRLQLLSPEPSPEPQSKRFKSLPSPYPKTPTRSKQTSHSTFSSSPFARHPPGIPIDTPTNPFGRLLSNTLAHTLPPATHPTSHLTLRLQFVRTKRARPQGGIHRIVRVPRNFTFLHLKFVVEWAFGVPLCHHGEGGRMWQLFEMAEIWGEPRKGEVSKGKRWCLIANDKNPYAFRELGDELFSDLKADDTHWEEEGEYTVGNVWLEDEKRLRKRVGERAIRFFGVVGAGWSVHITRSDDGPRKKKTPASNLPTLIEAHGKVRAYPYTGAEWVMNEDGEVDDKDEAYDEFASVPLDPTSWTSFSDYFAQNCGHPKMMDTIYEEEEEEANDNDDDDSFWAAGTPGLTFSSDPPSFDASLSSSPLRTPQHDRQRTSSISLLHTAAETPSTPTYHRPRLANMRLRMGAHKEKIRAPRYEYGKDWEDLPPDEQERTLDGVGEWTPERVQTNVKVNKDKDAWLKKTNSDVKWVRGNSGGVGGGGGGGRNEKKQRQRSVDC